MRIYIYCHPPIPLFVGASAILHTQLGPHFGMHPAQGWYASREILTWWNEHKCNIVIHWLVYDGMFIYVWWNGGEKLENYVGPSVFAGECRQLKIKQTGRSMEIVPQQISMGTRTSQQNILCSCPNWTGWWFQHVSTMEDIVRVKSEMPPKICLPQTRKQRVWRLLAVGNTTPPESTKRHLSRAVQWPSSPDWGPSTLQASLSLSLAMMWQIPYPVCKKRWGVTVRKSSNWGPLN